MFLIKSLYLLLAAIAHFCGSEAWVSNGFSPGINSVNAGLSRSCFKRWTERPKFGAFILVANRWYLTYKIKALAFACFEKIGFFPPSAGGIWNPVLRSDAALLSEQTSPSLLPAWVLTMGVHKLVGLVLHHKERNVKVSVQPTALRVQALTGAARGRCGAAGSPGLRRRGCASLPAAFSAPPGCGCGCEACDQHTGGVEAG